MKWVELTVFTTETGLDAVAARFDMLGIDKVSIEESRESIQKFLSDTAKYWDYADTDELVAGEGPCVKAYIADMDENAALVERVKLSFEELKNEDVGIDLGSLRVLARLVDDEDWANNWKLYYKPTNIGKRLFIKPTWETAAPEPGRVLLELDPGMAFGTGTHQTTRMCLEALDERVKGGEELLDLGCGSGILSIAGVLLGARSALAIDIDPVAEKTAYENAAVNHIGKAIMTVRTGDVLGADAALIDKKEYDVITANIVATVIIALVPGIVKNHLKKGGVFITSGIILERLEEVKAALKAAGFELLNEKKSGEWAALVATL